MNYKKGLTRLFIIGLFLAPLVGIFKEGESITKVQMIMWDVQQQMITKLADPTCAAIVNANPKNFSDVDTRYSCYPLSGYWDEVKKYQSKSGDDGKVTDRVIEGAMESYIDAKGSKMRWEVMGLYLGGYLIFCLLGLIGFFIAKWVIKGFQSQ